MKRYLSKIIFLALSCLFALSIGTACYDIDIQTQFVIHTVTINVAEESKEVLVVDGQRLPRPKDPEILGMYFDGWYVGDELYDFSSKVTEDFILDAKLLNVASDYQVYGTVKSEEGELIEGVTLTYGSQNVKTRRDGSFGFDSQETKISVSHPGYRTVTLIRGSSTEESEFNVVLVKEDNTTIISPATDDKTLVLNLNDSIRVKIKRVTTQVATGTSSSSYLSVRFEVLDSNLTSIANMNNVDQVCMSDSVEFYIDALGNGGLHPQTDDYQIDVSVNGFYRFCKGTGTEWVIADNFANCIITPFGSINSGESDDLGYIIEIQMPFNQLGITDQSDICFSLGQSGYGDTDPVSTWNGWTYKSEFVDPQMPAKYRKLGQDGISEIITVPIEIDQVYVDGLAKISAPKLLETKYGEKLYIDNDTDMLWKTLPENMIGTCYAYGYSEGGSVEVETDGYVIMLVPSEGYASFIESIIAKGWTLLVENGKGVGRDVLYETYSPANNVYVKECVAGEVVEYSPISLVFGAGLDDKEEYFVHPWNGEGAIFYDATTYNEPKRLWQGIPCMVALPNDNLVSFYFSGDIGEPAAGNYGIIDISMDGGKTFKNIFILEHSDLSVRVADIFGFLNCDGTLIIQWTQTCTYNTGILSFWQAYVTNPCDDPSQWNISEPYVVAEGLSNNKPTLLSDGSYIISLTRWNDTDHNFVYKSYDKGLTWELVSKAYLGNKVATFAHECSIVELENGTLWMLSRATQAPYYEQYSYDGGITWTQGIKSTIPGAYSRGVLYTLEDGRILCVTNEETRFRGKLTAYILTNDGNGPVIESSLLLDARGGESYAGVAYPDITCLSDGRIVICWDYDRRGTGSVLFAILTIEELEAGGTLPTDRILIASILK